MPRIAAKSKAAGIDVNHKRVARAIRRIGVHGVHLREKVRTTVPGSEPARDVMHRQGV